MTRRILVFLVCTVLCLGTQLACTSDPPPSVALREHEPAPPKPAEPLDAVFKRPEEKRDVPVPEIDQPSPNVPEGLEVFVEQVGPSPLPYQKVRLRFTFHNNGKEAITDTRLLVPPIGFTGLRGPNDKGLRSPGQAPYMLGLPQPGMSIATYPTIGVWKMMREERLTLQPGEKIAITGALGSWRAGDGVFEQPGDYQLQLKYVGKDYLLSTKPITVTVGKPQGADAEALRLLQKRDASLTGFTDAVCYANRWLGKEYNLQLKEIVDQHPRSTYADYARYLLTCRAGSGTIFATSEEAHQTLDAIDVKTFPFGADVLLKRRLWAQFDKARIAKIEEKLDADFYDTDVWIKDQAERLTFAQLMERRKPPAERKQPQPAKP